MGLRSAQVPLEHCQSETLALQKEAARNVPYLKIFFKVFICIYL